MAEDFRVKYIRSINNVLETDKNNGYEILSDEDRENLCSCTGCLFECIRRSGRMSKELAEELGLLHLWEEEI